MFNSKLLSQQSFNKQNPEFAEAVHELDLGHAYASQMFKAGKLTREELADFEAIQYSKFIDALPIDLFHEMMHDGRLDQLQALAGHDGTRNGVDVDEARQSIENKIKLDALDDAWLNQKIDSVRYADECHKIEPTEELGNRLADGDHDGVASEFFASRHDSAKNHGNDLLTYLKDKYSDAPNPDAPPGRVEREHIVDMPSSTKQPSLDGIIDLDAEEAA